MMTSAGFKTRAGSPKRIHHACLDNLHHFLEGKVNFEEWTLRQEELESQLSPHPELPLPVLPPEPEQPEPARPSKRPVAA